MSNPTGILSSFMYLNNCAFWMGNTSCTDFNTSNRPLPNQHVEPQRFLKYERPSFFARNVTFL